MTVVAHLLLVIGGVLAVVAGLGAYRFSTAYARIHAAGVASPIAFLVAGLGAIIELELAGAGYIVIAALAMLVTLPVGAHLLFRAVHRTTDNSHLRIDDLTPARRRANRAGDLDAAEQRRNETRLRPATGYVPSHPTLGPTEPACHAGPSIPPGGIMTDVRPALDISAPDYNIADRSNHERVRMIAEELLSAGIAGNELVGLGNDDSLPLDVRVATRVAASKLRITEGVPPMTVAVVIAMWGEQRRLRPPSDANPTGEDSLHVKLDQLEWLLDGSPVSWRLNVVDDGDPEDSAAVALERAAVHRAGDRVTVLRLGDAISADTGPLAGLAHVDDSRKGGAIVYGAATAMADGCDAVIMTDADNSVDLAQIGLLIGGFADGADVVVGDRKDPNSVLVKAEARWGPGIVALRHMQRMVGRQLFDRGLRDTQAAFKLYGRRALEPILAAPSTYGFAFDSDWLYATIASDLAITSVPFAFIDSFAESASITQGPMTTWESLLRGLVAAARARGVDHDVEMAAVIDEFADAETLERVVAQVPPQLMGIDPSRLGDVDVMSPAEMKAWIAAL